MPPTVPKYVEVRLPQGGYVGHRGQDKHIISATIKLEGTTEAQLWDCAKSLSIAATQVVAEIQRRASATTQEVRKVEVRH